MAEISGLYPAYRQLPKTEYLLGHSACQLSSASYETFATSMEQTSKFVGYQTFQQLYAQRTVKIRMSMSAIRGRQNCICQPVLLNIYNTLYKRVICSLCAAASALFCFPRNRLLHNRGSSHIVALASGTTCLEWEYQAQTKNARLILLTSSNTCKLSYFLARTLRMFLK